MTANLQSSSAAALQKALPVSVDIEPEFGWRRIVSGNVTLWFKGYLFGGSAERLAADLAAEAPTPDTLPARLYDLDGHFALAAGGPGWKIAAVDRCRTIPMYWAEGVDGLHLDSHAARLAERTNCRSVDPVAALSIAMAGYTIGPDTLYRRLSMLTPGEALWVDGEGPRRLRYHRYEPWRGEPSENEDALRARLAEVTLAILKKMAASADGRTIAIPLSAGLDSRLIASGLRHIGYDNVRCFAYGQPGNYEAKASRKITAHLGYPWQFVPYRHSSLRRYLQSDQHRDYLAYVDSLCSTPFLQDLPAVHALKQTGYLSADAILVNGNSGDYISGLHIRPPLRQPRTDLSETERRQLIIEELSEKHFRLWQSLATTENDQIIARRLSQEMERQGLAPGDPETDHGIYEFLEFQDRQSKYVISGQRIYEFLGHDWRLPLWDNDYLDFWQAAPLSAKAGQRLYREMLETENWGGVWQGPEWQFPRHVSPRWMRWLVRPAFKALHIPLGAERWHRFERNCLSYWTEAMPYSALYSYRETLADSRAARHFVAWHTERYLASKGLKYDGGRV